MFMYHSTPKGQGKLFCTTPGCEGWIWNTRRKTTHCKICLAPIDWSADGNPGGQATVGKGKGKGKAGAINPGLSHPGHGHPGAVLQGFWPPLVSGPGMHYPAPWQHPPSWPKGKGAQHHRGGSRPPWEYPPPPQRGQHQPDQSPRHDKNGGKGGAVSGQDAGRKGEQRQQAEQELALAQQEVQFYRRMEQRGMLASGSRQVQEAAERLRKARMRELGSRTLPQQAKSLRDKLQSIHQRLEQQKRMASAMATQMCELCDKHEALAGEHVALKIERREIQERLDLVEQSAAKEVPTTAWQRSGQTTDPMDQAFLEFQDKITALFPDIDKSQQESLNSVIGEAYRAASHIQNKKLGDRQERAKRSRTGRGEAVSGPRHFQPGHMEDTPAQQDGDGDKEGDDVRSDISGPDNNNFMDDVKYPPVPTGTGDDVEDDDLIRPPATDDRADESDSGRTVPFYEGDEEF